MNSIIFSVIVCLSVTIAIPVYEENAIDAEIPEGKAVLADAMVGSILRHKRAGAQLYKVQPQTLQPLVDRLIDNATLIRETLVDTFSCAGRAYGYYADQDNGCQVFHVCVNFHQIFPHNFTEGFHYQFSFICPKYTIFSQDALVCAWSQEAVPCEVADQLYDVNKYFFKIPEDKTASAVASIPASSTAITSGPVSVGIGR